MRNNLQLYITVGVSVAASAAAYLVPSPDIGSGDLYHILYIHVPSAWICYLALFLSFIASIFFLVRRKEAYDSTAEIMAVLGLVSGAVSLLSGSIWAGAAWGSYWNWDPRETTTLILWISYVGYISLKLSIGSAGKKKVIGAVYNIFAFLTVPLSYLSIILIPTLHPQIIGTTGISLSIPLIGVLLLNLLAATLVLVLMFSEMSAVWRLERRVGALVAEHHGHIGGNQNV